MLESMPPRLNPRSIIILILVAVFLGLATLCLSLRIYTNTWIKKQLGLEDFLVLVAYVGDTINTLLRKRC